MKLQDLKNTLLWLTFPSACLHCRRGIGPKLLFPLCEACLLSLPLNEPPLCLRCGAHLPESRTCTGCSDVDWSHIDHFAFVLRYQGSGKRLLQRFKINESHDLIPLWTHFLKRLLPHLSFAERIDAIVPIPPRLHSHWNQWYPALHLALILSRLTGAPVKNVLSRTRRMQKQSTLGRRARRENVHNGFRIKSSKTWKGQRVLLVDDVVTTGYTADSCADIFKRHHAASVACLAGTRAVLRSGSDRTFNKRFVV